MAQNELGERQEYPDGRVPLERRLDDFRKASDGAICSVLRYDDQLFEQRYLNLDRSELGTSLYAKMGVHFSSCGECESGFRAYVRRAPPEVRERAKELADEYIEREVMPVFREYVFRGKHRN